MSEITDASGRKIKLRTMTVLDQIHVLKAVGAEHSDNQRYVQMVECVWMVDSIDGIPFVLPKNENQIDKAISLLGNDGMSAVMLERVRLIREAQEAFDAANEVKAGAGPLAPSA